MNKYRKDPRYQKDGMITEHCSDEILRLYYAGFAIQHIAKIFGIFEVAARRVLRSRLANLNKQKVCKKGVPSAVASDTNLLRSYTMTRTLWKKRIREKNKLKESQ